MSRERGMDSSEINWSNNIYLFCKVATMFKFSWTSPTSDDKTGLLHACPEPVDTCLSESDWENPLTPVCQSRCFWNSLLKRE